MAEKQVYECQNCGKKEELTGENTQAPECCGKEMQKAEPLPFCEMSPTAEHSRFDDFGEPCDDGRASE